MGWTRSQRGVLSGLLACLIALTAYQIVTDRLYIPQRGPIPAGQLPGMAPVADRLDPNTATWEALAIIPGMGESRAKAIVAHRAAWTAQHPDQVAFQRPQDLMRVKDIGEITMHALERWLVFPETSGPTEP